MANKNQKGSFQRLLWPKKSFSITLKREIHVYYKY